MTQQSGEIVGEGGHADFAVITQRRGLPMCAAVESNQSKSRRRSEQAKWLVYIATQAMLKNKRDAVPGFLVVKFQPVVMKDWH